MSTDPIETYIRKLRRHWWWRRDRDRRLAEVEDHLLTAAQELEKRGMTRVDAERQALDRLGKVDDVLGRSRARILALGAVLVIGGASTVILAQGAWRVDDPVAERAHVGDAFGVTSRRAAAREHREKLSRQALVASIERRMGAHDIVSVVFRPSPPEAAHHGVRPAWMWVRVRTVNGSGGVKPYWHADLLAWAFYTLAPEQGVRRVAGISVFTRRICLVSPENRRCDASGGPIGRMNVIPVGSTSPVPYQPTTDRAPNLRRRITAAATSAGVKVISMSFSRIAGLLAPNLVIQAPTSQFKDYEDLRLLGAEPNDFVGTFIELDDPHGDPIAIQGIASGIAAGTSWRRRPGLRAS